MLRINSWDRMMTLFHGYSFLDTRNPKSLGDSCCLSYWILAAYPGGSIFSLGTRTSRPTEPRRCRMEEAQTPPSGSLGMMAMKATSTSTLRFPEPCLLSTQRHVIIIDLRVYCVLEVSAPSSQGIISKLTPPWHLQKAAPSLRPAAPGWHVIGKDQWIPWSYTHCCISFVIHRLPWSHALGDPVSMGQILGKRALRW